jgi:hypothetical protein
MRPIEFAVCLVVVGCGPNVSSGDDDDDGNARGGSSASATGGTGGAAGSGSGNVATGGQSIPVGGTTAVGSGGGPYDPPPDSDDDGVSDPDEASAGTNPHEKDTDADGCDDLLEATFGECNLETMASVYSCGGQASLVLTMAAGTGSHMSDLTTEWDPIVGGIEEDLWAQATEVTPEGSGDIAETFTLSSVEPSARVTFRVLPNVVFRWSGVRTYALRVSSASGGLLAEGKILWRRPVCPPPPE